MFHKRAQYLRRNLTEAEKKLWWFIRERRLNGYKFRRQAPIGPYIVDFVCFDKKVIVELDGYHHKFQKEYDQKRKDWLRGEGFQVLRFWNQEVMRSPCTVLEIIKKGLGATPTLPSPIQGEE
jgi:very-short-patch-repair endonuclease